MSDEEIVRISAALARDLSGDDDELYREILSRILAGIEPDRRALRRLDWLERWGVRAFAAAALALLFTAWRKL